MQERCRESRRWHGKVIRATVDAITNALENAMRPNHFSNCHRIGLMIVVAGVLLSLRPAAASAEEAVGGDKCTP